MAIPELIQLEVSEISQRHQTSSGNCWIECSTNRGVVAIWGKSGNMRNIEKIEAKAPPFKALCGCIPSHWSQHVLWVPESATIKFA